LKIKNIDELCEDYLEENASMNTLAKKYNCRIETIRNNLHKSDNRNVIEKLNSKKTIKLKIDYEELYNEYLKNNITLEILSKKYKCSITTIWEYLNKSNNKNVYKKLRKNKPSEVKILNKEQIIVLANNTEEEYIFPIYLYDIIKQTSWGEVDNKKGSKYLRGSVKGKIIQAHYLVIGCPLKGYEVDHIDRNTKNNMPNNLRIVTKSINNHNKKIQKNNTTGYKGVSYNKKRNRYRSTIKIGKETIDLGYFIMKEEAALSYFNIKYNLLGYEYMTDLEIKQYNDLLTYFIIKN